MFNKAVVTNKGLDVEAESITMSGYYGFSRMYLGDGTYTEEDDLKSVRKLKSKRQEFTMTADKYSDREGRIKMTCIWNNEGLTEGYYITEVGIVVRDYNSADYFIFAIATGVEGKLDYMPSETEFPGCKMKCEFYLSFSNDTNISIEIGDGLYALAEDVQEISDEVQKISGDMEAIKVPTLPALDTVDPDAELTGTETLEQLLGRFEKAKQSGGSGESLDGTIELVKFSVSDSTRTGINYNNVGPYFETIDGVRYYNYPVDGEIYVEAYVTVDTKATTYKGRVKCSAVPSGLAMEPIHYEALTELDNARFGTKSIWTVLEIYWPQQSTSTLVLQPKSGVDVTLVSKGSAQSGRVRLRVR